MIRIHIFMAIALSLLAGSCSKSGDRDTYMDKLKKTEAKQTQYEVCERKVLSLVSAIEKYKIREKIENVSAGKVRGKIGTSISCPEDGTEYEIKSIICKPDEEPDSETIKSMYEGDLRRTFRVTCGKHRIIKYGK